MTNFEPGHTPSGPGASTPFGNVAPPSGPWHVPSGTGGRVAAVVWLDGRPRPIADGATIGRDATNAVVVDHPKVSRRHAQFRQSDGRWFLIDQGSTNGLHDGHTRQSQITFMAGRTPVWLGPPGEGPGLEVEVLPGDAPPPTSNPAAEQAWSPPSGPVDAIVPSAPTPSFAPPSAPSVVSTPPAVSPPVSLPSPPASSPSPPASQLPSPPLSSLPSPPSPAGGSGGPAGDRHLGQLSAVLDAPSRPTRIGRSDQCDLRLADPLVSRIHAELVVDTSGYRIRDLNSDNGTFVDGARVSDSPVHEGQIIEVGRTQLVLANGQLRQHQADGLPLQAENVSVIVDSGAVLLSDVSFTLPAGSLTAVIGPSGAGKSTLVDALTGRRPAEQGRVTLGGRDVYATDEGTSRRIGFVPQHDAVHEPLSVRRALAAAAKLRLPPDTSTAELDETVNRVAAGLGLTARLDLRIRALSGGQRKRVSVGYELVGAPQALILDEPTSGLDPGLERELMLNLRTLADEGTTTMVVTHSVASVELCDLVLVLAPGGRLAFIGPPSKVAGHFGCGDMASVFNLLATRERAEWELEFARTTSYLKFGAPVPVAPSQATSPLPPRSWWRDFTTMLVRYVYSIVGDRKRLALLLLQAPILGLILSLLLYRDAFGPETGPGARQYLLATVLSMTWLGGSNSVREIVDDREVFRREAAVGVSSVGFVLSKWVVLATATVFQAVVLHLMASLRQEYPLGDGVLIPSGPMELMVALAGVGVVSVGMGLVISALSSDTPRALTIMPLVIIPALLLSGLVVPTSGRAGVEQLTYLNPVQWGGAMAAVTVDLPRSEGCNDLVPVSPGDPNGTAPDGAVAAPAAAPDSGGEADAAFSTPESCDNPRWEHRRPTQVVNLTVLTYWVLGLAAVAAWAARWTFSRPVNR
ncbi:MAG: FHA domain-containing protein [Acidimicrobiales bacterium]